MKAPRLGIVEDPKAQHEGQGRGDPELEKRPGDRDYQDQRCRQAPRRAGAEIAACDQLVEFFLAQPAMAGSRFLDFGGLELVAPVLSVFALGHVLFVITDPWFSV